MTRRRHAELPNVKKAYADWHDKGFEIVGISFDSADMEEKLKKSTTEIVTDRPPRSNAPRQLRA